VRVWSGSVEPEATGQRNLNFEIRTHRKTPSSKLQAPEKSQTSNPKSRAAGGGRTLICPDSRVGTLELEAWSFSGAWNLELGAFLGRTRERMRSLGFELKGRSEFAKSV
jgi:hypothetical protein